MGCKGPPGPIGPQGPPGPTLLRASASFFLAIDEAILVGVPRVGMFPVVLAIPSGVALVHFTASGLGESPLVVSQCTFQLTIDGVSVCGVGSGLYDPWKGSWAIVYRAAGLAPGPHTFALNAQTVVAGTQIYAASRPLSDHASLVVQELDP